MKRNVPISRERPSRLMVQIVLHLNFSMSRFLKSLVVSLISLVLLYYSSAWAVLRCLHDDDDANSTVALFDTDVRGNDYYLSSPSAVESHLDCLSADYHTESLAGPASPPQLHRWATHISFHVTDFLSASSLAETWARDLWLRAVFERPPRLTFLVDSPLYLSLSILRV